MTLAFLISAFKDPQQLLRLVKALPEGSECFVHVDRNIDISLFTNVIHLPYVHFIEKRVRVMWGSFTQVQFQMELIRAALASGVQFDYLFMISGQDYPVWSNDRIISYLRTLEGRSLLQGMCIVDSPHSTTVEYKQYRFLNNRPWKYGSWKSRFRVALRKLTSHILKKPLAFTADGRQYRLYKGADYFAVTLQLAAYVLQQYDECPQLRRYFSTSFAPSETFIHTVAFNSPYAADCMLTSLPGGRTYLKQLTPLTYIEYTTKIKELTEQDFDRIIQSDKMLCRKCVTGISDRLLDMIDAHRLQRCT